MTTAVRLVSYKLADLGQLGEFLTKQTSFLVQPYARLARIASRNFGSLLSPAIISHASLHKTNVCTRHYAIFKRYASKPTKDRFGIKWRTWSRLERTASATGGCSVHIYTYNFSPQIYTNLEDDLRDHQKPKPRQKPEGSHLWVLNSTQQNGSDMRRKKPYCCWTQRNWIEWKCDKRNFSCIKLNSKELNGSEVRELLSVACLTFQQLASVYHGRICSILRTATLRQKLQIKLSISLSHSILISGRPVPALTL